MAEFRQRAHKSANVHRAPAGGVQVDTRIHGKIEDFHRPAPLENKAISCVELRSIENFDSTVARAVRARRSRSSGSCRSRASAAASICGLAAGAISPEDSSSINSAMPETAV